MAKGYWVSAYHAVHDQEKLAGLCEVGGSCQSRQGGGKFLARGTAAKAYEQGILQRTVIVEFESVAKAIETHDGAGYQAALKALGDGVSRDLRVIEGV